MDIKKLAKSQGLTVAEFCEIGEILITTTTADIKKIQDAIGPQEAVVIGRAAHSIKGAAGNMGFFELSETAQLIEKMASDNKLGRIIEQVELLVEQTRGIEEALNKIVFNA